MVDRLVVSGHIDRRSRPDSRRKLIVDLTRRRNVVDAVTAGRREEIAGFVAKMPEQQRRGLVRALTAFTAAGGELPAGATSDHYALW